MLGRLGILDASGGDRIQVEQTAFELRKLGVEVDIKADLNYDPTDYDIIHVFQLDWVAETYFYVKKAKEAGKPVILSPIHHSVKEVKLFDDTYVFDFRRISRFLFKDQFHRDVFKNVYRSIGNLKMLKPTLYSVFHDFKKMQMETLSVADEVLVQTQSEAADLKETYGVDFKYTKVVNGVGSPFINMKECVSPFDFRDYILSVGRIEPRKNQLSIIEAMKKLREESGQELKLVFVGKKISGKHFEYTKKFNKEIDSNNWIIHREAVPYEEIPCFYTNAKVSVSASWFETTGLTSLEALFCNTNAVASGDRAKEYLGGFASYCDPSDIDSIKDAIKKEFSAPRPTIPDNLRQEYTWENAARKTLEVYNKVLGS